MSISLICAVAENGAIGHNNRLLFHLRADLQRFKSLTSGHTIIMGRNTFESLPKGALPNRRNIVLSRTVPTPWHNTEIFRLLIQDTRGLYNRRKSLHHRGSFCLRRSLAIGRSFIPDTCTCESRGCWYLFSLLESARLAPSSRRITRCRWTKWGALHLCRLRKT